MTARRLFTHPEYWAGGVFALAMLCLLAWTMVHPNPWPRAEQAPASVATVSTICTPAGACILAESVPFTVTRPSVLPGVAG